MGKHTYTRKKRNHIDTPKFGLRCIRCLTVFQAISTAAMTCKRCSKAGR